MGLIQDVKPSETAKVIPELVVYRNVNGETRFTFVEYDRLQEWNDRQK